MLIGHSRSLLFVIGFSLLQRSVSGLFGSLGRGGGGGGWIWGSPLEIELGLENAEVGIKRAETPSPGWSAASSRPLDRIF